MKANTTTSSSKTPRLTGLIVFLLIAGLTQFLSYQRYLIVKEEKHNQILREINSVKDRLQTALSYDLAAVQTLKFVVEEYGVPKNFDSIAKRILQSNKFIDALELTQGGEITNVYPLQGNEAAIGYNILEDSLRNQEAYKAIDMKSLYFAGPFELKQGGVAVVGRLPIFINNEFQGFAAVLIKISTLLKAAGIDTLPGNEFVYQLSKVNPTTLKEEYFLPESRSFESGQSVVIEIPDGEWKLHVMSKNKKAFLGVLAISILGFLLSLVGGIFAWYLARQPLKLNKLVEEKTRMLQVSEARLIEAQALAKVGSWETNLSTMEVTWSLETYKIFEIDPVDFKHSHPNFLDYVHPLDREMVDHAFKESIGSHFLHVVEHRAVSPSGAIKYVEERWKIFYDPLGNPVRALGTCQDLTERKQAQLKIIQSEKDYKNLFENNPSPMFIWNFKTTQIIDCNEEVLLKYGYTRDEFLNLTIKDIRPLEDVAALEEVITTEEQYGRVHKKVWRHKKKSGEVMFLDITGHLIDYNGTRASLVMLNDITEKLKAEEELKASYDQLKELTGHLQRVREEERTRIAREIHDELGQQLTGLKMDTSWILKSKNQSEVMVQERLSNMILLIDDTIQSVRRIASELRPGILDDLGLIAALEWQTQEFEKRTGIRSRFKTEVEDSDFDINIVTNIFRVYQEALTNVARHSQATLVETALEEKNGVLSLIVKDNGVGLNLEEAKNKKSLGLVGMKERALMLHGNLIIKNEEQRGVTIALEIPLQGKDNQHL